MRENGHDTQNRGPGLFISKPTSWQSGAHTNIMTGRRRKEPPGDSNHRPSAYKAESLSIREWLRCSKWAEFGTYHTARRLVKGKEKLKRVSCTQKNGLELVHPERVRPGEAQNGGLEEKKRLSKKDCVLKPVEPWKRPRIRIWPRPL